MEAVRQRNYKIDNIKTILIFLVVFGHMMELVSVKQIYLVIYSFHMPAFIFVTGYYAKFRPRKILLELIMPYVLFQTLYLLFDGYMKSKPVVFQFTTPYWLMWYLLTIIIYYLLLPCIRADSIMHKLPVVILSIAISLLAGFDSTIGYYMSLSRTLVFLPFFVLGNYIGQDKIHSVILGKWYGKAMVLLGVILSSYYIITAKITPAMLYGAYSYEKAEFGLAGRAILLLVAMIWIIALFQFVPNIKLPVFSNLGKGTFSVFLIHGFIQRWLRKGGFFDLDLYNNFILAIAVSVLIVLLFGNQYFSSVFNYVVRGRMIREKKDIKEEEIAVSMERAS